MLEILILFKLCTRIGNAARKKGRRPLVYQLMLIGFWAGGELGSALLAVLIYSRMGSVDEYLGYVYLWAMVGAISGALLCFGIVRT